MFNFFSSSEEVKLKAPLTGKVVDLSEVPDKAFANKIVGDGVAIEPTGDTLVSPVKGVIKQIFSTKHAVGIETEAGIEVLIHIGIDTVDLEGEGFEKLLEEGTEVSPGDEVIKFEPEYIKENATALVTPFVITNSGDFESIEVSEVSEVTAGEDELLTVTVS